MLQECNFSIVTAEARFVNSAAQFPSAAKYLGRGPPEQTETAQHSL
jgi:hypothetical protein